MNTATTILVVVFAQLLHQLVFCLDYEVANVLCLHQENKINNCQSCTRDYTDIKAINNIMPSGNFVIQFCSDKFNLTSELVIRDKIAVNITGYNSKIVCNPSSQGILIFSNVTQLRMQDISFHSCGASLPSQLHGLLGDDVMLATSIFVVSCTDVTISNLTVNESFGNGLTMIDNDGRVEIKNCNFNGSKNIYTSNNYSVPVGSGLYLVLSYCHPRYYACQDDSRKTIANSQYVIRECNFSRNVATHRTENIKTNTNNSFIDNSKFFAEGFGRGGGLSIVIDKNSTSNKVNVSQCNFIENSAIWGGGLNAVVSESSHNSLYVIACKFYNNSCKFGGGGADVSYQNHVEKYPHGNIMVFEGCSFHNNKARFGGGLRFHSSLSNGDSNAITLSNCNWMFNTAHIGAAIYIASFSYDFTTKIAVSNCMVMSNHLTGDKGSKGPSKILGRGILLAKGCHINFEGTVMFSDNRDSAMYLISTEMEFRSGLNITFASNTGFEGGAINMQGLSVLILNDDVKATFIGNTGLTAGGAIYQQTSDIRDFFNSQHCFIIYKGNSEPPDRNITLHFINNTAGGIFGHKIYATTIVPCWNSGEFFNSIISENQDDYEISTSGNRTILKENESVKNDTLWIVPGKQVTLPIQTLNDLGSEVLTLYHLSIENVDNSSSVSASTHYVFDKLVRILGRPGDTATLVLKTTSIRQIVFRFLVRIQKCPPGFRFSKNKMKCECFSSRDRRYSGLSSCNDVEFAARINQGYWMGYKRQDEDYRKEKFLLHSFCPLNHCSNGTKPKKLPNTTNEADLETVVCAEHRFSILCSSCKKGYAINYHDYEYNCKKVNTVYQCKVGMLFFILSEILPVTVFFALVILLNIKFTDGAVSGFLLYVQLSDVMRIEGNGFMPSLNLYKTITRIFNLNFFAIDGLSFCLWEKANTLDIIAFKYITIFYSLILVLVLIAVFRYCLFLLTPSHLFIHRTSKYHVGKTVAFYNGNFDYFQGKHLLYALPALVIVFALGILPPLVLISYPLCYKVLAVLKLGESRFSKLLCTVIPLEKFKPFFDSFQSGFKDEYRFFSGLYFLYRFTALATFAFSDGSNYHIVLQIQLSVFLATHALCQPYKKRWHNILDTALLTNLCAVNALSHYNYTTLIISRSDSDKASLAILIQILLLYSALAYMLIYTVKVFTVKFGSKVKSLWLQLKMKVKRGNVSQPDDYYELEFSLNAAENRL